jgi:hypothetical protein
MQTKICVYKSPSLVFLLCQKNHSHINLSYFFKISFNMTLPSTPRSSKRSFPLHRVFFPWLTDKSRPNAPPDTLPALHRKPRVGEV